MKKTNFLRKKIINEKTTSYITNNFHIDFRFKFFNFYNEINYMKRSRKLDKIFCDLNKDLYLPSKDSMVTLSVLLTNDNEICKINKKFRNKNKPTNVLSFPSNKNYIKYFVKSTSEFHIGDIILSMERIFEESIIEKKSLNDHFLHILIHGILHILGYDHVSNLERKEMEKQEIKILKNLGIKDPYV